MLAVPNDEIQLHYNNCCSAARSACNEVRLGQCSCAQAHVHVQALQRNVPQRRGAALRKHQIEHSSAMLRCAARAMAVLSLQATASTSGARARRAQGPVPIPW